MPPPVDESLARPELRIAVVGAGAWGHNIVRVLSRIPGCDLTHVCDAVLERAMAVSPLVPRAQTLSHYPDLLSGDAVDAIAIATPAATHAPLALAALQAGKHVFLEKPMALRLSDAQRIRALARRTGLRVMVGHVLRYHAGVVTLSELLDQGFLGRVERVRAERSNRDSGRDPVGPWWSLAPHDLSVLRRLLREDPASISARPTNDDRGGLGTIAQLRYASGVDAEIVVSHGSEVKVRRLIIAGTRGAIVFEEARPGRLVFHEAGATEPRPLHLDASIDPLEAELTEFVRAASDGSPISAGVEDGCAVVAALEAGQLSINQGGAMVITAPHDRGLGPQVSEYRSPDA